MPDRYVAGTVPAACLAAPGEQPEYRELPGADLGPYEDVARLLADRHVARGDGDRCAALHAGSGRTLSYAELAERSDALARGLAGAGLRLGDRVAIRATNVPEVLVVALAAWKAGGVVVPTSPQARADELRHFLDDSGARFLFVWEGRDLAAEVPAAIAGTAVERVVGFGAGGDGEWAELLAGDGPELPVVPGDALAIIWYTGGTTGKPKGCYHTHRRFALAGCAIAEATGVQAGERWACAAPVGHALGFIHHTIYTVMHGATAVFVEDFNSPAVLLDAIARHRVDTFTAVAASWARMLELLDGGLEADLSSLRRAFAMWQSASSSEVYDGWLARGVELRNNFGSTSFATWVLVPRPDAPVARAALGRPAPGYEVAAVELDGEGHVRVLEHGAAGRMAVKGPSGLTYWNLPDAQRRDVVDGWTLVDDLIRFDEHGDAHYLGRTDFLISTAGYKVAPVEVEAVLAEHPAVREVCVIGTPDPIRQEVVTAFVALAGGVEPRPELTAELQQLVRERLSPYKYPRRVEYVDAIPRDGVGKVQQRALAARLAGAAR